MNRESLSLMANPSTSSKGWYSNLQSISARVYFFLIILQIPLFSEKGELIFKNQFLTIMFPIDRYSEMGPSSRTLFSNNGFTCLQVLDHIYAFYQENMSAYEIEVAIHSYSRHADRFRSVYCSKEAAIIKRIEFLGSRKSFEMLKRVSGGDDSSNVYELLIRAL